MKKLLVLGGTLISCEIVKAAQQMGIFVAVADYYDPEDSPAKMIADANFKVSATDVDAIVDLIEREKIDGVLTGFSDILLIPYAEICEKSGLPCYGTKELFSIFTNKKEYKRILSEYGIPVIGEYSQEDIDTGRISFPVLVKPVDNSGARGLSICHSQEELIEGITTAKDSSKTGLVLVEPYIEGKECTVFLYFDNGRYFLTAVGNRHIKEVKEGVIPLPVGYTYPSKLTEKYIKEVFPSLSRMFKSLGVKDGMMFMQCKIRDSVCYIYDVGYRLTGSLEYINFESTCGYNPLKMLIRFAVYGGGSNEAEINKINPFFNNMYAFNVSCLLKPGKIETITGTDEVKGMPCVDDLVLAHLPEEIITEDTVGKLSQIGIRILGHVKSKRELYKSMSSIHDMLHVVSSKGEEMILPGISLEELEDEVI